MNFLAHLYLTQDYELISVGNFMSDAVKGKNTLYQYPLQVQQGILIHREIDNFTDNHPLFRKGVHRLRDDFGKTSTIIMDIFYDHILAKNWIDFSDEKLETFIEKRYVWISKNHELLPDRSKFMFRYMKRDNWLLSYRDIDGIESILKRMDRRMPFDSNMQSSIGYLIKYENEFKEEFYDFFNEIRVYILKKINDL